MVIGSARKSNSAGHTAGPGRVAKTVTCSSAQRGNIVSLANGVQSLAIQSLIPATCAHWTRSQVTLAWYFRPPYTPVYTLVAIRSNPSRGSLLGTIF